MSHVICHMSNVTYHLILSKKELETRLWVVRIGEWMGKFLRQEGAGKNGGVGGGVSFTSVYFANITIYFIRINHIDLRGGYGHS